MTHPGPRLLLVNPWIYDFAAHDFFAAPLGLLTLAGSLERQGFALQVVDFLAVPRSRPSRFGTGRYPKEQLPTPPQVAGTPRRYGRYGASEAQVRAWLAASPQPAAILVTSLMTYWYPGVKATIVLLREYFPHAPVLLGGIYATLCPEHARHTSGADLVVPGWDRRAVIRALAAMGLRAPHPEADMEPHEPYPALHLHPGLSFLPLLTSRGCPFACQYCASGLLYSGWQRRPWREVVAELLHWRRTLALTDVAFYDDALLFQAEEHLFHILEEVQRAEFRWRFHTPNALHARFLSAPVARLLKRSGFVNPRLGVETTALGAGRYDGKLAAGELEEALANLHAAGYQPRDIGVYLLLGLPDQDDAEVAVSITRVRSLGATPILAQYSPIPGTGLWPRARAVSRFDLAADPLFHNPSLFPCWPEFSWERFTRLKKLAQPGQVCYPEAQNRRGDF